MDVMKDPCVVDTIVNASPQQVWAKMAEVNSWKMWRKTDPKVQCDRGNALEVGDVFKWVAGGAGIVSTVTESVEGEVFTWRGSAAMGLLKAHHRWKFAVTEDGQTKVTCEEEMSGPLKFMMGKKTLAKVNTEWCEELKAAFDSE